MLLIFMSLERVTKQFEDEESHHTQMEKTKYGLNQEVTNHHRTSEVVQASLASGKVKVHGCVKQKFSG